MGASLGGRPPHTLPIANATASLPLPRKRKRSKRRSREEGEAMSGPNVHIGRDAVGSVTQTGDHNSADKHEVGKPLCRSRGPARYRAFGAGRRCTGTVSAYRAGQPLGERLSSRGRRSITSGKATPSSGHCMSVSVRGQRDGRGRRGSGRLPNGPMAFACRP